MTKMKRYPRFLALLATLALLLNSVPLILQAAADNAAMTLRVLEDFTGLVPGGEVGSLTVDGVNKGTVAAAESPGALGATLWSCAATPSSAGPAPRAGPVIR